MLTRLPELKKRAHLAHFLRPPSLPEDLFADEQVVALVQQLKAAQEEFTAVHKQVDAAREKHTSPAELEKDTRQLESELEQLDNKLLKLRSRVQTAPEFHNVDFDDILSATHALRKEQEEEAALGRQLREQRHRVDLAMQRRRATTAKLHALQDEHKQHTAAQLLQQKRDEAAHLRSHGEQLDKAIRERDRTFRELAKTLTSSPLSLDMVEQLQYECEGLAQELRALTAERDERCPDGGEQVSFCRKRLGTLEEKRDLQLERAGELEDERKALEEEVARLDGELRALTADGKVMTESQLSAYAQGMKAKMETVRTLKAQLGAAQREAEVLQKTEAILRSRDSRLSEIISELEQAKGVVGYADMVSELEKLGLKAGDVNADKGNTLDQVSRMVELINNSIKAKRTSLQPLIRELKEVRHAFDATEQEHSRRHKQHEAVAGVLRVEREKLVEELGKHRADARADEASMHQLRSQMRVLEARLEQGHREDMYVMARGRLNREFRTFQDRLERVLDDESRRAKVLQEDQKQVMQSHQGHVGQRKLFSQLRTLLGLKQRLATAAAEDAQKDDMRLLAEPAAGVREHRAMAMIGAIAEDGEEDEE
jgi:intraflagellar transport protein 81